MHTRLVVRWDSMRICLLGLLLLTAGARFAGAAAPESVVEADTPQKLAEAKASVDEQMAPGGRYEFISTERREQVGTLFREMQGMLERSGSVAAMPERDRLQLFNRQEKLNGILTDSDSQRLVCEKRAPLGSLVPVKTCRTYGEIERQRRDKDRFFDETRKRSQSVHGD